MESILDDCLAQFSSKCVLKEEHRQAVLGLQGQKDVVAVFPTGFERSLIYQLLAAVKLRQREKNVRLVASPLRSIIKYDQVEAMREAGVSAIQLPCGATMHEVMRTFFQTESYHRRARFIESWF